MRAADYVLGDAAGRYLHPSCAFRLDEPIGSAPYSDDDLMRCLQEIENMRTGKRPKPDMSKVPGLGPIFDEPDP